MTLHGLAPVGEGKVQYYLISTYPLSRQQGADDPEVQEELEEAEKFMMRLIEEDRPIMNNIRFKDDTFVEADAYIARYLGWLKRYPRGHASAQYIT